MLTIGTKLVPSLFVRDIEETLRLSGRLGFQVTAKHPVQGAPTWAEVRRDPIVLRARRRDSEAAHNYGEFGHV
jgi:hypothetical protein